MTLRTIKGLITGLAGFAVLFAGVTLIAVPKAEAAIYCTANALPPGNWQPTNVSCGGGCGTLQRKFGSPNTTFCLITQSGPPLPSPCPHGVCFPQ